jgi:CDP-glucose 4,6-dehydratase
VASTLADIRNTEQLTIALQHAKPDIVFHLAAQPLVRKSYREPLETYTTNVTGTLNVLEAARACGTVKAVVVVTSDKVYENQERSTGYTEADRLGGHDPYSSSKACCEILAASYRNSYFPLKSYGKNHATLLATVRAGNVIGGGDWAEDRLLPDAARAGHAQAPMVIRSPKSIRPWQHVLEPLCGYLRVGQKLLQGHTSAATSWNFGPRDEGNVDVGTVVKQFQASWPALHVQIQENPEALHETKILKLDSTAAEVQLGWKPIWLWSGAVERTALWYKAHSETGHLMTESDLMAYVDAARTQELDWVTA